MIRCNSSFRRIHKTQTYASLFHLSITVRVQAPKMCICT